MLTHPCLGFYCYTQELLKLDQAAPPSPNQPNPQLRQISTPLQLQAWQAMVGSESTEHTSMPKLKLLKGGGDSKSAGWEAE